MAIDTRINRTDGPDVSRQPAGAAGADPRADGERQYHRYVKAYHDGVAFKLGIRAQPNACAACKEAAAQRYDADALPRLPLHGCTGDGDYHCTCRYGVQLRPSVATSVPGRSAAGRPRGVRTLAASSQGGSESTESEPRKWPRLWKINLAGAGLVLGACYLLFTLVMGTSSPLQIAQGTSMEPGIHAGDVLLNKRISPADVKIGDTLVLSVPPEKQRRLKMPSRVAHRVVDITGSEGQLAFVTKGDNSDVDPFEFPASSVQSKVVKNLGPWGKPIRFLTNKAVLLYVGLPILTFGIIVLAVLSITSNGEQPGRSPALRVVAEGREPVEIGGQLDRLAEAIGDYAVNIKSHTAVVMNLGGTTGELLQLVEQQNEVVGDLAAAVMLLKSRPRTQGQTPPAGLPRGDVEVREPKKAPSRG